MTTYLLNSNHARIRQVLIGLLICYFSWSNSVFAAEFQSLQSIRMQAEAFLLKFPYKTPYPPQFEMGHLDNRLRLTHCPQALQIEFARPDKTRGNTALNLYCQQLANWKLILPVRIDLYDDVLVLDKPLLKGQKIDTRYTVFQKQNIARLNNGYYSQHSDLSELETRRNLPRGAILTPASLRPRLMVKSGQMITLVLDYKGLQIKTSGQALQSARKGQIIKVRNNQSQRIVEGVVFGEAQVRVQI